MTEIGVLGMASLAATLRHNLIRAHRHRLPRPTLLPALMLIPMPAPMSLTGPPIKDFACHETSSTPQPRRLGQR